MTPQDPNLDPLLEQAIADIHNESVEPALIESAARRVQARLEQHAPLRSCADFQALIPEYRAGMLSEARALLLKDHTRECVACRKVFSPARPVPISLARRRAWSTIPSFRWAMAAAATVVAALATWTIADRLRPVYSGPEAVVQSTPS